MLPVNSVGSGVATMVGECYLHHKWLVAPQYNFMAILL